MATAKRKTPGSIAVNRATTGKGDHTRTRRTLRTHPRVTASWAYTYDEKPQSDTARRVPRVWMQAIKWF